MFEDSLCDAGWAERTRRGGTTVISLVVQGLAVAVLLTVPLFYTQRLPPLQWIAPLLAPSAPPAALPQPAQTVRQTNSNLTSAGQMIEPRFVPMTIQQVVDTSAPAPVDIGGLRVMGGTGDSQARNAVLASIGNGLNNLAQPPPRTPARPLRISQMMEGNLVHQVQPQYPSLARQAGIQGIVVLQAVIDGEGRIANLRVVSGPPLLRAAALDAVGQWRYRPYYLNGQPIEVETQVTVNFTLAGR